MYLKTCQLLPGQTADVPRFLHSLGGKKINQKSKLFCFLLYFTLITERNSVTEKIQSKRVFLMTEIGIQPQKT